MLFAFYLFVFLVLTVLNLTVNQQITTLMKFINVVVSLCMHWLSDLALYNSS